ncbi:MAG: amidohydrolase family protein [Antricoccus sp.]
MAHPPPVASGSCPPLPANAIDNHCHVLDPTSRAVPGAQYAPFDAPVGKYEQQLRALGINRGVLVTASTHGTNNQPMLNALRESTSTLRGIAVVDRAISDDELIALHNAGVRGLRLQDQFVGGTPLDALGELGDRIVDLGWHLEVWTDLTAHLDWLPDAIQRCAVPVVLDHLGYFPMESPQQAAATGVMIDLARAGDAWITVSGAYRLSPVPAPSAAGRHLAPRVHQLLEQVPDRLLWGSDWPHVAPPHGVPTIDELLAELDEWCGHDPALIKQLTVTNNAACYNF